MAAQKTGPYGRFWRDWLLKYRGLIAVGMLAMVLGALTSAGYTKGIQAVMHGFETADPNVIWWGPITILLLTSTKALCKYFFQTRTGLALVNAETDAQIAMHEKLVYADLAALQNESAAALTTRFTADIYLARTALKQIFEGISSVLIIVATVLMMLTIDWLITVSLVVVFAMAIIPVNRIGARIHKISRNTQDDLASMSGEVSQALSGIRMARTYQLEGFLTASAQQVFGKLLDLKQKLTRLEARLSPMMEALSGAAIAVLLIIVAWRLSVGQATLADFMALMAGLGIISQPARSLGQTFAMAKQGEAALDRVFEIIDLENTILDADDAVIMQTPKGNIDFKDVGFAYPDGKTALSNINLHVEAGNTVAFVGRSGAGKSTIFNLLPRLYDVSEGRIEIDGVDIRMVTQKSLRQQIALVGQESILLAGSVAQNIGFGRENANADAIEQAAIAAAAHDFINALPNGYEHKISNGEAKFSGGEKQRLSIARAMLRDAPILLLDEPTSALDAASEAAIREALQRLSKGRTTLVIAHRLSTIMDADKIIVMDHGQIAEVGSHAELLAQQGIYAELYRLQIGG